MVTTRSLVSGIGLATGGAALGYFGGTSFDYLTSIGRVDYLNDITSGVAGICRVAGYIGGPLAGAYHAFFSPDANPPAPPAGPAQPRNVTNIRIVNRGGRNNTNIRP